MKKPWSEQTEEEKERNRAYGRKRYANRTPEQVEADRKRHKELRLRPPEQIEEDRKDREATLTMRKNSQLTEKQIAHNKKICKKYGKANNAKLMLLRARKRAEDKGWPFDLTEEWIQKKLDAGICECTGLPFIRGEGGRNIFSPSIDRFNSSKGYTMNNCRVIIFGWNCACNAWGEKALLMMVEAFKKHEKSMDYRIREIFWS